jgi:hypothetical protein
MTRRDFYPLALGVLVGNWLVVPTIMGGSFTKGFLTGLIAVAVMPIVFSLCSRAVHWVERS